MLIAMSAILIVALILFFCKFLSYNAIDCKAIYEESKANDARGIAANLTPEAIQKCY